MIKIALVNWVIEQLRLPWCIQAVPHLSSVGVGMEQGQRFVVSLHNLELSLPPMSQKEEVPAVNYQEADYVSRLWVF